MAGHAQTYDVVNNALNLHLSRSVRAEELEDYSRYFINPRGSDSLLEAGAQIIYGRGGTGKTLLTAALSHGSANTAKQTRVAALHFTATDFQYSPDYDTQTSTHEKTHVYFHLFIEQLCNKLVDLTDTLVQQPGWWQGLTPDGEEILRRREKLFRLRIELLDAARFGVTIVTPGDYHESRESKRTSSVSKSLGAGASASLGAGEATAKVRAGGQFRTGSESQDVVSQALTPRWRFSPLAVKAVLVQIVEELDLSHLVIFVDEWMTLGDCQVDFAERLKNTFMHERRIAIKIASDRFQTRMNNSGESANFRGIDVGRDASLGLDLDASFQDSQQMEAFYAEALYVRLNVFDGRMADFFGVPPHWNPHRFTESLFATPHAFTTACAASHGVCRDFYDIVRMSYKRSGTISRSSRITIEHVRSAILDSSNSLYARANHSPLANRMLYEVLAPHIRETRSRYFAVGSVSTEADALTGLLSKRIVHPVNGDRLHPTVKGRYQVFEIAAAVYSDLMRAVEFATGDEVDDTYREEELLTITESSVAKYLVSPAEVRAAAETPRRLCPHCSTEFYETERAFKVRGICPRCFMDVEEMR